MWTLKNTEKLKEIKRPGWRGVCDNGGFMFLPFGPSFQVMEKCFAPSVE
jgi:hypothetical protein